MALSPKESQWVVYPPNGGMYTGFQTNIDPSVVPDTAFVNGQNTYVNEGDRISTRPFGLTIFPQFSTPSIASGGVRSMYTFRLRTGENIMMRAYSTFLQWFDEVSELWINLQTARQSDDYGFAEFNINANAESRLYFGNGLDNFAYWNGGHTNLTSALVGGEAIIPVTSTASFSASGSIIIGGTTVTYSGITATTFTGAAGTPAAADDLAVAQAPTTDGAAPKGNIYMTAQNRLFIVPSNNKQIVMFCAYGDSTSWSTTTVLDSTATSAGAFNLIEGGGEVTALTQDELNLYFLKDACIYAATLSDSYYTLQLLKPFDGRSRAVGALGRRGVFVGGNIIFVVTPDNQIKALQRLEQIDYPQLKPISQIIQPTCNSFDFSFVSGIAYREYAYFACRSSSEADFNDIVLPFNLEEGHWEAPIVGWNVSEWTIYDDGTGEKLYFGDSVSPNTWLLTEDQIIDGEYQVTSGYKTKQYDFGLPSQEKDLVSVYVEGYISPSTDLTIRLLYDEGGYTGVRETTFSGDETDYILDGTPINAFGLLPFGTARFGANEDLSGLRKFRIFLQIDMNRVPPFFNCQLEFLSTGLNQRWEVIRYGFLVRPHSQPTRRKLLRTFT